MLARARTDRPSRLRRVLRTVFWALVFAFVFGFVVGTFLRRELDRPVRYIGALGETDETDETDERVDSGLALAARPCDIGDPLARVLVPGHHEEQV
jgi:hypothetical protein